MKLKVMLILVATLTLSGCSLLKRFERQKQVSYEPAEYNFLAPRRQLLDDVTAKRLDSSNLTKYDGFSYYSASGYRCKTLSTNPVKSACNIEGKWLLSPLILMNNSIR